METETVQRGHESGGLHLAILEREEKSNLKEGNRLISHLHAAVKAGKLYDSDNEGFQGQIKKLRDTFAFLFLTEDIVSLEVYMHCLFFNRVKIQCNRFINFF